MTYQTSEEAKQEYITKMAAALGEQYAELVQEIAQLHLTWFEFVELFGTKKSRIELLNNAAPHFFRMVQDRLWEAVMLEIARLTDRSCSFGDPNKPNLTLRNLPTLIDDKKLKAEVERLCTAAFDGVKFARDWRNRHIAHRDLKLALGKGGTPLPQVPLKQVNDALASFEIILNTISGHFLNSEYGFRYMPRHGGALELIYLLDDGLTAQKQRQAQIAAGDFSWQDYSARDL